LKVARLATSIAFQFIRQSFGRFSEMAQHEKINVRRFDDLPIQRSKRDVVRCTLMCNFLASVRVAISIMLRSVPFWFDFA
jgi:hypothetical protein